MALPDVGSHIGAESRGLGQVALEGLLPRVDAGCEGLELVAQEGVELAEAACRRDDVDAVPDDAVDSLSQVSGVDGGASHDAGRIVGGEGRHHGHGAMKIGGGQHGAPPRYSSRSNWPIRMNRLLEVTGGPRLRQGASGLGVVGCAELSGSVGPW